MFALNTMSRSTRKKQKQKKWVTQATTYTNPRSELARKLCSWKAPPGNPGTAAYRAIFIEDALARTRSDKNRITRPIVQPYVYYIHTYTQPQRQLSLAIYATFFFAVLLFFPRYFRRKLCGRLNENKKKCLAFIRAFWFTRGHNQAWISKNYCFRKNGQCFRGVASEI